jgi:preprotein translocase subunit YajC
MAGTDAIIHELRDPALRQAPGERQVRRAWALLLGWFAILLVLVGAGLYAGRWYILHATAPEPATLQSVTGQGVLIQRPDQADWRPVAGNTTAREGDAIFTNSGSVGWVTLFDRSTVEVSENSKVTLSRMRTSRFLSARKEFTLEPIRGTIYVGMAPRGDFAQSQIVVSSGPARVTMRDVPGSSDTGSFLVEVQRETAPGNGEGVILTVRVGVLRGIADVETSQGIRTLSADEQTIISSTGAFGPVTEAVRELARNGDFSRGMSDWVEYQDPGRMAAASLGWSSGFPPRSMGTSRWRWSFPAPAPTPTTVIPASSRRSTRPCASTRRFSSRRISRSVSSSRREAARI